MKPLYAANLHQHIESVVITFFNTGETLPLTTREGSGQHFFPHFLVGNDEVHLRLDWSDLDDAGRPTLDADFVDPATKKRFRLRGEREASHHTKASDSERRLYEWKFRDINRPFYVTVTWRAQVTEVLHAADYSSAEVVRGGGGNSTKCKIS